MAGPDKLSNYPFVRVRIRCERCGRAGDLSLARLAERFGADTTMWDVMLALTADCKRRRRRIGGRLYAPCYAQLVDLVNGRPPDLPPGYRVLEVLDGGKAGEPCSGEEEGQSSQDVRTRRANPSA